MFQGFTDNTIEFLWQIRFNNEKSWFLKHKDEYKTVLEKPMHELAREVYDGIMGKNEDLNLRLHVSRIYRDARRLHGNGPYKDRLWFTLRQFDKEWAEKPVFWFELAPDRWTYGLGYYTTKALNMEKLRARIDNNPEPLVDLDRALEVQSEFVLEGDAYARPKCEPGNPLFEWYNKKSFSLIHEGKVDEAVLSPDLAKRISGGFEFLIPYYKYFMTMQADPDPRF